MPLLDLRHLTPKLQERTVQDQSGYLRNAGN